MSVTLNLDAPIQYMAAEHQAIRYRIKWPHQFGMSQHPCCGSKHVPDAFAYAYYRHKPSNGFLDSMALQFQQLQPPASP